MTQPPDYVDESLIDYLLSLTPEQRIEAHESARQLADDLKKAGTQIHARPQKTTPPTA